MFDVCIIFTDTCTVTIAFQFLSFQNIYVFPCRYDSHQTYGIHEQATYFSPCHELIDRDVRKCEEGCQTEESEECYQPMGSLHPGTQESQYEENS